MVDRKALGRAARYMAFGVEFATVIVVSVILGYHLDRVLGSAPALTLVLTLGGMIAALRRLLWSLKTRSRR
jgi:F0F1-type ATP synthase assembly protein I